MSQIIPIPPITGGSGPPSGPAGGALGGTYPNPTITLAGDVTGPSASNTVVNITGTTGVITIGTATTGNVITWAAATTAPGLSQTTTAGTGANLTIQAQNSSAGTGGALNLTSGTGVTAAGLVNIQSGGTTIASINSSKFITSKGRRVNVTATAVAYQVLVTDEIIAVGAITTAINVTLPATPTTGDLYEIKDTTGIAATHNISIVGNGNNIDGTTPYVMSANYEAIMVVFTAAGWSVV